LLPGVCALGAVAVKWNIDISHVDVENANTVAKAFKIAPALAREIMFETDEVGYYFRVETPEQRYQRMLTWARSQILLPESP
jgi:hypothetical protein